MKTTPIDLNLPVTKNVWNSLSAEERWLITEALLHTHPALNAHIANSHRIAQACERYPRQLPSDIVNQTRHMPIYTLLQHLLNEYGEPALRWFFTPLGFTLRKKRLGPKHEQCVYMLMYDNSNDFKNDTAWALDTRGVTFAIIDPIIIPARHTFPRAPEWQLDPSLAQKIQTIVQQFVWASEKADGVLLNVTILPEEIRFLLDDTTDLLQQALLHAFPDCALVLTTKNFYGVHPEILPLVLDVFLGLDQASLECSLNELSDLLKSNRRLNQLIQLLSKPPLQGSTLQFELLPQDKKAFAQYLHDECKITYPKSTCLFLGLSATNPNTPSDPTFTPHFACPSDIRGCLSELGITEPMSCQVSKLQLEEFIQDTNRILTSDAANPFTLDDLCKKYEINAPSLRVPAEGWVLYHTGPPSKQYIPIKLKTTFYKTQEAEEERARGMEAQSQGDAPQKTIALNPPQCEAYFPKLVYYVLQALAQQKTEPDVNFTDVSDESNAALAQVNKQLWLPKLNFLKTSTNSEEIINIEQIIKSFFNLDTIRHTLDSKDVKKFGSDLVAYVIALIKGDKPDNLTKKRNSITTGLEQLPVQLKENPAPTAAAAVPAEAKPANPELTVLQQTPKVLDITIVGNLNGQDLDVFMIMDSIAGMLAGPSIPEEHIKQLLQQKYPDLKNLNKPLDLTFCVMQNGELAYAMSYKLADRKKNHALLPMDLMMRSLTLRHTGLDLKIPLSGTPKLPTPEQAVDFLADYLIAHASDLFSDDVCKYFKSLRQSAYIHDQKPTYTALLFNYLANTKPTDFFANPVAPKKPLSEEQLKKLLSIRKTLAMRMIQFLQITQGVPLSFYKTSPGPHNAPTMLEFCDPQDRRFLQAWLDRDTRTMDPDDEAAFIRLAGKIAEAMQKIHPHIFYNLPSFEPFALDIASVPKQKKQPAAATASHTATQWTTLPVENVCSPLEELNPALQDVLRQTIKASAKKLGKTPQPQSKGAATKSRAQKVTGATAAPESDVDSELSRGLREWAKTHGLEAATSDAELFTQCAHYLRGQCDTSEDIHRKTQAIQNELTQRILRSIATRAVGVTEGTTGYLALLSLHPKPAASVTNCVLANPIGDLAEQRDNLMRGLYWEAVVSQALEQGTFQIDGQAGWTFIKPGVLMSDPHKIGSPSITPDGFVIHPQTGRIYPVEIKVLNTEAIESAANRSKEELAQAQLEAANLFCGAGMRKGLQICVHYGGATVQIRHRWTPLASYQPAHSPTVWKQSAAAAAAAAVSVDDHLTRQIFNA